MQSQTRGARAILAYIERPYERSPLFQWLLAHHDELIASAGGRRMEWTRFCGTFETAGLTAWDGKPVNAATARKTWQRVRKEDTARSVARRRGWPGLRIQRERNARRHGRVVFGPVRQTAAQRQA
jgi:hypothetical protein